MSSTLHNVVRVRPRRARNMTVLYSQLILEVAAARASTVQRRLVRVISSGGASAPAIARTFWKARRERLVEVVAVVRALEKLAASMHSLALLLRPS